MNSPYMGDFKVTQIYKLGYHNGLDLVGISSKEIHATVSGRVVYAGWENSSDKSQGFGLYVCIQSDIDHFYYYYGHLSELKVKTGDNVKITDVIGIEGSTGYSTGSHCHYEIRDAFYKGATVEYVPTISGIPNECGTYNDGYSSKKTSTTLKYPMDAIESVEIHSGEIIINFK